MSQPTNVSLLLVEDNPADARLVQELLEDSTPRHSTVHVETLAAAQEALARHRFDVVLLDLSLPDSRGLATFHALRDANADVPIVVLTGLRDEALALEALESGAQDYLAKDHADRYTLNRAVRYAIQRRNAERVEAERRSLENAIRGMERVLGVVGHELRTPLGAFRILLEAVMDGHAPCSLEHSLNLLMAQVTHMSETVTNVLEAARLDSGMAKWQWTRFPITDAVEPTIDLVRPLLEPGVEIAVEVPSDAAMLGDAEAVRRLLINLLSNAAKHTPSGCIKVTAALVPRQDGLWMRLCVMDTGRGIPPKTLQDLGRAFALNTGVVGACSTGGTGLGLSICAAIAAAHAGHIEVTSDGQTGSCFTVWLRADLPAAAEGSDRPAAAPLRIGSDKPFTERSLAS